MLSVLACVRSACSCGRRTTAARKAGDTVQVIDLSVLPGLF